MHGMKAEFVGRERAYLSGLTCLELRLVLADRVAERIPRRGAGPCRVLSLHLYVLSTGRDTGTPQRCAAKRPDFFGDIPAGNP
jgi:hypothetical protein